MKYPLLKVLLFVSLATNYYFLNKPAEKIVVTKSISKPDVIALKPSKEQVADQAARAVSAVKKHKVTPVDKGDGENRRKRLIEEGDGGDTYSYQDLLDKQKVHIENYIIEELNLNYDVSDRLINIINETEKKISQYLEQKTIEDQTYMFQPDDYVYIGLTKSAAREKVKDLLGGDIYRDFMRYVHRYNQGKQEETFVPIDL